MLTGANSLKSSKWVLICGVVLIVISPLLLTKVAISELTDFTETGQIGDTIGGITAPIVNLLGAILVYFALEAQVKANSLVQEQLEEHRERSSLETLYYQLKGSIDEFSYTTLDKYSLNNKDNVRLKGSEAIYQMINDFYCDYHEDEEEMECNPKIMDFKSILEISIYLIDRIESSNLLDKETIHTLTLHQVRYRIMPKVNDTDGLDRKYCDSCECDHGFPDSVVKLIENLTTKLNSSEKISRKKMIS